MSGKTPKILIVGCTASGKGTVAFELARRLGGEILSVDSMKVYRRMDIGTAKPDAARRQAVRYHLVDMVEPWEPFSVGRWVELAEAAIGDMEGRQRPIIAAGGTAMYLRALLEGLFEGPGAEPALRARLEERAAEAGVGELHRALTAVDPEAAARIHRNDLKRIVRALEVYELTGRPISSFHETWRTGRYRYDFLLIWLRRSRADASGRINERVRRMIAAGLVDEVKSLLAEPGGLSPQARQAVGYAEIIDYLAGGCGLADAIEAIKINTRRLAKAQRTWFRSFAGMHPIDVEPDSGVEEVADVVERLLAGREEGA